MANLRALSLLLALAVLPGPGIQAAPDPTLYEYYTSGGIQAGLSANGEQFTLNGKHFVIYGGSLHYFRVVPEYWRSVLARIKAAGINAVQFYVPWNLHEGTPGKFDFESAQINLDHFLQLVKEADMFAIARPGPYICAEWEFGGLPAWLLHDPKMQLRTNYGPFLNRVKLFWDETMKIINKHQFTNKGPVIALQLENEYSSHMHHPSGDEYLHRLQSIVLDSGFKGLLFQSDPSSNAINYPIKGVFAGDTVLQTANLNGDAAHKLSQLRTHQPGRPLFVSEFWTGWFDQWNSKKHATESVSKFEHELSGALFTANGSVNFYMFIGGTNFGFMNGGHHAGGEPVVTSYDYDAQLTESGNYTAKYHKTREIYQKLVESGRLPKTHLPSIPPVPHAHAYGKVAIQDWLSFEQIVTHAPHKFTNLHKPIPMELLPIGKDYGQAYGFVVYRTEGPAAAVHTYEVTGTIRNRAILLLDGHENAVTTSIDSVSLHHTFGVGIAPPHNSHHVYDLIVENEGRANGGNMAHERRGILEGDIKVNGEIVHNITIFGLDFEQVWLEVLKELKEWQKLSTLPQQNAPALYRTELTVEDEPRDTFLTLPGWTKGNVFVNGFNLGRYWGVGPQKTLYLPAPLLKKGANTILVFELHKPGSELVFVDHLILG